MNTSIKMPAFGFIVLIASFCHVNSVKASVQLVNPGFETVEPIGGTWPTTFGDWNGDKATVTAAENGISPASGNRMVRFDYGASILSTNGASQVEQLIDISSISNSVLSGQAIVNASACFNRVVGDAQTDTEFRITLAAYAGLPADHYSVKESNGFVAYNESSLISDDILSTWEPLSASLLLPTNTTYVSIELVAIENTFNDISGVEFDGHYADDVVVAVSSVPEQSSFTTFALLSIGFIFCRPLNRIFSKACNPHFPASR